MSVSVMSTLSDCDFDVMDDHSKTKQINMTASEAKNSAITFGEPG